MCTLKIRLHVPLAFFFSLLTTLVSAPSLTGQVQVQGQWRTEGYQLPINPIHVALMHNGKILVVAGSGNNADHFGRGILIAGALDPQTGAMNVQTQQWDMFCEGMTVLPDGRVFIAGGNFAYSPFLGDKHSAVFDPLTEQFADLQPMPHGRWYPTTITLSDGRVLVFGGTDENNNSNNAVAFYTVGVGWSQDFLAPFTPPLYPRLHQLPNGTLFYSGPTSDSHIFDVNTHSWTLGVAHTNYGNLRIYGSSVLLPLQPADGYRPRIMILGGGDRISATTASTEIIDLSMPGTNWVTKRPMSQARIEMNAVILPTGKILALGGSSIDEDGTSASLAADLYDPATDTFSSAGTAAFPRLYHSDALLLPDATVWVAGSNPPGSSFPDGFDPRVEIYSPAYLFDANGGPAVRPRILNAPAKIGYGGNFQVQTDTNNIRSVALMRAGSDTHAFDFDQRMIELAFNGNGGVLTVNGPSGSNLAPPGYYMLFLLNQAGTPSVAQFVQVSAHPTDQPPRSVITAPASDVTIHPGDSVTFAGTATDSDGTVASVQWVFPGGTPGQSNSLNPGNVRFDTPGDSVVTLTAVDNQGLNDPSPPTRVIHISTTFGFRLTFVPESGSEGNTGVVAGGTFRGSVVISPQNGYAGTISLNCSQPQCSITPSSVTVNGSPVHASLAVTTTVDDSGGKQLTVTGTDQSDPTLHSSVNVTYAVVNYSVSSSTGPVRINAGQTAQYTITAALTASGVVPSFPAVSFACSGLPAMSSCSFSPASLVIDGGSASTALSITTTPTTVMKSGVVPPLDGNPGEGRSRLPLWALCSAILGIIMLIRVRLTSKPRALAFCGLFALMLAIAMYASGCRGLTANSGTDTHTSSQSGTPSGTYRVVVTGTAGQIGHSTNVTLTVN